jgi:adenylosuccinate synthase
MNNNLKQIISQIESIKKMIDNSQFTKKEYKKIQNQLKNLTKATKFKKNSTKILDLFDEKLNQRIIKYCRDTNQNLQDLISETLVKELDSFSNIVEVEKVNHEEFIKDESEKILKRWKDNEEKRKLFETDGYVISKNVEFVGHTVIDGKPVYNMNEDSINKISKNMDLKKVKKSEISRKIMSDESRPIYIID